MQIGKSQLRWKPTMNKSSIARMKVETTLPLGFTKRGQDSPIYKGWKPCKLSMAFTPDCSQLSFNKYYKQTKCSPEKNYQLDCIPH